jgi:hypothetical protein
VSALAGPPSGPDADCAKTNKGERWNPGANTRARRDDDSRQTMQDAEHVAAADALRVGHEAGAAGAERKKPAAVATGSYGIPAFVFPKLAANYEKSMNAARAGEKKRRGLSNASSCRATRLPADRFTSVAA